MYVRILSVCGALFLLPRSPLAAPRPPKAICAHNSTGALTLRAKCKRAESRIATRAGLVGSPGSPGAIGATGPAGPTGADGKMGIFGDGSAGAATVSSPATLATAYPDGNFQFSSLTIDAGSSLTVASGTVVRVTGDVVINGALLVQTFARGGWFENGRNLAINPTVPDAAVQPHPGISARPAGHGEVGANTDVVLGGRGGAPLSSGNLLNLLKPGIAGGGGGAAGGWDAEGGRGGGALTILAQGSITIGTTGSIGATGGLGLAGGGGGGGGGVIILASHTAIAQSGQIDVSGGNGGNFRADAGNGGGGGGGLVRLVAPQVSPADGGTILKAGGAMGAGASAGQITANPRSGGGGGGGSAGSGSFGSDIESDGSSVDDETGGSGVVIVTTVQNPEGFF